MGDINCLHSTSVNVVLFFVKLFNRDVEGFLVYNVWDNENEAFFSEIGGGLKASDVHRRNGVEAEVLFFGAKNE